MIFHPKWLPGGAWGVANDEIWSQEALKWVEREAKGPKSGPKEAQRGSKDGQRIALGGQKEPQRAPKGGILEPKLVKKWDFHAFLGNLRFCENPSIY